MASGTKFERAAVWDLLVDYRRSIVFVIVAISLLMAWIVRDFTVDPTFKSFFAKDSVRYQEYESYVQEFGDEESILVAIKYDRGVLRPDFLQALETLGGELLKLPSVRDVVSISNLKVFARRDGLIGAYNLIPEDRGMLNASALADLDTNRRVFPATNQLLSSDLKTAGLAVRLTEDWQTTTNVGELVQSIVQTVERNLPEGAEFRIVGTPVFKQRIMRASVRSGAVFFASGLIICLLASFRIFRSGRVAAVSALVSALSVFWSVGVMTALGIELNTGTSLAFGLYMIITMATVVHISTQYFEQYQLVGDTVQAAKNALRSVGGPCFMCHLTTAIGFGSIMVSQTPIMRQLGLIMALGVILSFILAISLTPALLIAVKPLGPSQYEKMSRDVVARASRMLLKSILKRSKLWVGLTLVLMAVMLAGVPYVRVNTQLMNILADSSDEIQDLRFVEANLVPVSSVELVIEGDEQVFKKPEVWREVAELHGRLEALPEVGAVDSLPPLLEYLHDLWSAPGTSRDAVFTNPRFIPQILAMMSLSREGQDLLRRYVNGGRSRMHMSVKLRNPKDMQILDTIGQINLLASSAMAGVGKTFVTGEMALYAFQAADFARSQVASLGLAFLMISIVLMIQFRSVLLGLLSLLPNLPPLCVVFGIMGWFNIPLDQATTLVAAVSLGLAVDGTIHYLTQFARAAKASDGPVDAEQCVIYAHTHKSRALIANTALLFIGMILLVTSPFQPVAYFGLLTACSIVTALLGDLIFMPALILAVPAFGRAFRRGNW